METDSDSLEFEVIIDFAPGVGEPSRIFKSMGGLIEAIGELDKHLLGTIDTHLTSRLVLDSVEAGSLKAKLRSCVEDLPDAALKDGSIAKIVGHFLLKAKYLVLRWTSEKKAIQSRDDVKILEGEILKAAEQTELPSEFRLPRVDC